MRILKSIRIFALIGCGLSLLCVTASAQDKKEKVAIAGFAIGITNHYYPSTPNFLWLLTRRTPYIGENGFIKTYDRDPHASPRIELSADLVDGHLQTWYSIGLKRGKMKEDILKHSFEFPFAAGFRYYPWSTIRNPLSLYVGGSIMPMRFRQIGLDDRVASATTILNSVDAGIRIQGPLFSGYMGIAYFLDHTFMINLSETRRARMDVAAWIPTFNLSWRIAQPQASLKVDKMEEELTGFRPRLERLFVGGGMAFRHSTSGTAFFEKALPTMDPHTFSRYFPVGNIGYLSPSERWFVMLDHRRYTLRRENIGYELRYEDQFWRGTLGRYILNRGPLRPYLALGASQGTDKISIWHNGLPTDEMEDKGGAIHLMLGMDINMLPTSDWLWLRTLCTYHTGTFYDLNDEHPRMGSMEWSLQFLVFPARL